MKEQRTLIYFALTKVNFSFTKVNFAFTKVNFTLTKVNFSIFVNKMSRNLIPLKRIQKDALQDATLLSLNIIDLFRLYPNLEREVNCTTEADKQALRGSASVFIFLVLIIHNVDHCIVETIQKQREKDEYE